MNETFEGTTGLRKLRAPGADPILNELLVELHRFAKLLKAYGIEKATESPQAREAWAGLPDFAKAATLKGFTQYLDNCEELHLSGVSLRDNYSLLAHSLKKANLFAVDDIRGFLTNDNIAEVYNLDHIQIFRSINFFDLCNYSLLDLLAREWFVLYERLSSITDYAMNEFLLTLKEGKLRRLTVPLHILKERDSNPRGVFNFDFQYCCPLYSAPGVTGGYLLTENVTELGLYAPNDNKFSFLR